MNVVLRKSVKIAVDMHKKLASGGKIPYYNFEDSCGRAFMAANVLGGLGSITKVSDLQVLGSFSP